MKSFRDLQDVHSLEALQLRNLANLSEVFGGLCRKLLKSCDLEIEVVVRTDCDENIALIEPNSKIFENLYAVTLEVHESSNFD